MIVGNDSRLIKKDLSNLHRKPNFTERPLQEGGSQNFKNDATVRTHNDCPD